MSQQNTAFQDTFLTAREQTIAREQAIKAMRTSLDLIKPNPAQYSISSGRAAHVISAILIWAKVFVPIIALLAVLASSVRTVQTAAEIYGASGSHPIGVVIAAIAFTVSAEGALFALSLARQGERIRQHAKNAPRHVANLRNLWHGIQVRLGAREPQPYAEVSEGDGLGLVMFIALFFAVAANAYMGLRPLLNEIGASSLQEFAGTIWTASARVQLTFIVDLAGILFPPLMALAAGHLTARFAAEIAEESRSAKDDFERDLAAWREAYTNPLDTEDGKALMDQFLQDKIRQKMARKIQRQTENTDFLSSTNGQVS